MIPFGQSTHRKDWLFSKEDLRARKEEVNKRAFASIIEKINRQAALKMANDKGADGGGGGAAESSASIEERRAKVVSARTLSVAEEEDLKRYYVLKIREFTQFNVPEKVVATAIVYFKRFFLSNVITLHHPRATMLAAIYLAGKVEEAVLQADHIGTVVGVSKALIMDMEIPLLEGLRFDLIVHLPFNPLNGFIIDLKESSVPLNNIDELARKARGYVIDALTTDAPLLYPPAQIALGALYKAVQESEQSIDKYIEDKFGANPGYAELRANIADLQQLIAEGGAAQDMKRLKKINQKLNKYGPEPKFVMGTEEYHEHMKEQLAARSAQTRQEKLKRQAEKMIDTEGVDEKGKEDEPFVLHSNISRSRPTADADGASGPNGGQAEGQQAPPSKRPRTEAE